MVDGISGALMVALLGAPESAGAADYSIAFIRFDLPERAEIGSKRAGLLCLPNGSLRWGEVTRPAGATLIRAASEALEAHGLSLSAPPSEIFQDSAPPTRFRVTGVVTAVSASLCAPGWGLGQREAYKGRGRIRIAWSVHDQATRSLVREEAVEQSFELGDRGSLGGALEQAVAASAGVFAARIKAAGAKPAPR